MVDRIRCLKFSPERSLVVKLISHDPHKFIDIARKGEIGRHDSIDVFESEHVPCKFDAFSIVVGDTVNSERLVANTDSLPSFEDVFLEIRGDLGAFEGCSSGGFTAHDRCHFPIIEDAFIADFHHGDDLWKTDFQMTICTKSLRRISRSIRDFKCISDAHNHLVLYLFAHLMYTGFRSLQIYEDRHKWMKRPQVFRQCLQIRFFTQM